MNIKLKISIIVILCIIVGIGIVKYSKSEKYIDQDLTVNYVEGDVNAVDDNGKQLELKPGLKIKKGTLISSSDDGIVDIGINKKSAVRIKENSYVEIKETKKSANTQVIDFDIKEGAILSKIKPVGEKSKIDCKVFTPAAVCGIRGTSFAVRHEDDKTELLVEEGAVEITTTDKMQKLITTGNKAKVSLNSKVIDTQKLVESEKFFLKEVNMINFKQFIKAARTIISASEQETIKRALEYYLAMNGKYPDTLSKAVTNIRDPWGRKYNYIIIDDGNDYQLSSSGEDGIEGTADDIRIH